MNEQLLKKFIGKKVTIYLKSGYKYTGHIESIEDSTIVFFDKFQSKILITPETIITLTEMGGAQ
jgi:small nuclear ribonucleoprotein (snRNP)-like protein